MYKLTKTHYDELSILLPEFYDNDLYDIDKDFILDVSDKDLIIKVLDYYINYDLSFINLDNYEEVFDIFLYFGTEIGILLDCNHGTFVREINKLKYIDMNNNSDIEDYKRIIKFKTKIYNCDNRLKYDRFFNFYFEALQFNMDILNYNKYKIKYIFADDGFGNIDDNCFKLIIPHAKCEDDIVRRIGLPNSLTHIKFYYEFYFHSHSIEDNAFPDTLEYIEFECTSPIQKITKNMFPKSLLSIDFGHESIFNQKIDKGVLPPLLTNLDFGCGGAFNQVIDKDVLPPLLKNLVLGSCYNKKIGIDVLPQSLENLTFGYESMYNQKIDVGVLPRSLKKLTFDNSCEFNQKIDENVLPESLTHLIFKESCRYNQKIDENVLPESLTHLSIHGFYNQKIEKNVLPESLTHLSIHGFYNQKIEKDVLPESLTELTIGYNDIIGDNIFIDSLTHLTLFVRNGTKLKNGLLPNSLKSLTIEGYFDQNITKGLLPNSLESLTIHSSIFNKKIEEESLPNSLKYLTINSDYRKCIKKKCVT